MWEEGASDLWGHIGSEEAARLDAIRERLRRAEAARLEAICERREGTPRGGGSSKSLLLSGND